jgi:hypothetical protein
VCVKRPLPLIDPPVSFETGEKKEIHSSQRGEVGPIEAELSEYGEKNGPKPHAAVGFVLGAFGELSNSGCSTARPLRGWALPASRAPVRYRRRLPSRSASRRSCASGVLRRNAACLASSLTALTIFLFPGDPTAAKHYIGARF